MGMWKLKSCPRCGGDVFLNRDEEYRWYEQCLQCSYAHELKSLTEFHEQLGEEEKVPALDGETRQRR